MSGQAPARSARVWRVARALGLTPTLTPVPNMAGAVVLRAGRAGGAALNPLRHSLSLILSLRPAEGSARSAVHHSNSCRRHACPPWRAGQHASGGCRGLQGAAREGRVRLQRAAPRRACAAWVQQVSGWERREGRMRARAGRRRSTRWHEVARGGTRWHEVARGGRSEVGARGERDGYGAMAARVARAARAARAARVRRAGCWHGALCAQRVVLGRRASSKARSSEISSWKNSCAREPSARKPAASASSSDASGSTKQESSSAAESVALPCAG